MANDSSASNPATGPDLLSPRAETVVDASSVRFTWAPMESASAYRLEVSTDPSFGELVHAEETTETERAAPEGLFAPDQTLYYWRVQARTDEGWTPGEKVESFVTAGAEMAGEDLHLPQEDEQLGPYAGLAKGATVEAAAEVSGREELFELEREMGVAHEGIEAGQIFAIVATVVIMVIGIATTLIVLTQMETQEARLAATGTSGYPELRETEQRQTELLETYGYVDDGAAYRIPLEEAQRLLLSQDRGRADSAYAEELSMMTEN